MLRRTCIRHLCIMLHRKRCTFRSCMGMNSSDAGISGAGATLFCCLDVIIGFTSSTLPPSHLHLHFALASTLASAPAKSVCSNFASPPHHIHKHSLTPPGNHLLNHPHFQNSQQQILIKTTSSQHSHYYSSSSPRPRGWGAITFVASVENFSLSPRF